MPDKVKSNTVCSKFLLAPMCINLTAKHRTNFPPSPTTSRLFPPTWDWGERVGVRGR